MDSHHSGEVGVFQRWCLIETRFITAKNKVKTEFLPWKRSMFGVHFQTVEHTRRGPGWLLWDKCRTGDRGAVTCVPGLGHSWDHGLKSIPPARKKWVSRELGSTDHCVADTLFDSWQILSLTRVCGWMTLQVLDSLGCCESPMPRGREAACKTTLRTYLFNQLLPAFIPANSSSVLPLCRSSNPQNVLGSKDQLGFV